MNWLKYLEYFVYVAWHWDIRLAAFLIRDEIRGEKKYQTNSLPVDSLKSELDEYHLPHASIYQPVSFYMAESLMNEIENPLKSTGFLEAGCGKGRVIKIAAAKGFKNIYGFDLVPYLVKASRDVAAEIMREFPDAKASIELANAADYVVPDEVDVIFLFNPFDETVMRSFVSRIKESLLRKHRSITVLYANPVCKDLFENAGFIEINYFKKATYLEGVVLRYE